MTAPPAQLEVATEGRPFQAPHFCSKSSVNLASDHFCVAKISSQ